MRLDDYLKREKITASEFAARIGRSISTVTRAARGDVTPDPETILLIAKATKGEVSPNDFYDLSNKAADQGGKPEAAA